MEKLISKYIQNSLTPEEAEELRLWLEEDAHNRKVFENIVGGWKLSDHQLQQSKKRVIERIMSESKSNTFSSPYSFWSLWRVAAIVILGVSLGFFIYSGYPFSGTFSSSGDIRVEKEALRGQKLTFELPDGTIVKLNSGSKLTYPKVFDFRARVVELEGEAFFDVIRNEEKPFQIIAREIDVKVLGTSFNVKSYPDDTETIVAVKSGKVAVSNGNTEKVLLERDEFLSYSSLNNSMSRNKILNEDEVFGWTNQTLTFKDKTLHQIGGILERWYDVDVRIENSYSSSKAFTGSYKNPSLNSVMESLKYYYDFEYEVDGKEIVIK